MHTGSEVKSLLAIAFTFNKLPWSWGVWKGKGWNNLILLRKGLFCYASDTNYANFQQKSSGKTLK